MSEKNDNELLLDHNYDGIHELDNPLPKWWQITFYATIIFAAAYYFYYEIGSGPSSQEELQTALNQIKAVHSANEQKYDSTSYDLKALLADTETLSKATEQYNTKCAACHGAKGEGIIGPNLTDNYWIHGKGTLEGTINVIRDGVLDKGMPPWKGIVPDNQIPTLAAYIISLKGSNPPTPKEAQGELVE